MLPELKSRQILEYRKILKIVLDGLDSAYKIRQGLIEYNSASKYEYAKYDCNNDPEPYYHLKLFDKAIGIVRIYNKRDWLITDDESKYFHFAIRTYNFSPVENFGLKVRRTREYSTFGEFLDINDCLIYFEKFCKQLLIEVTKQEHSLYHLEIF